MTSPHHSKHRGMTLVEILVSLALLASVMVASTKWLSIAADLTATAESLPGGDVAVQRVRQLIETDLQVGDWPLDGRQQQRSRATASNRSLTITTRGSESENSGPCEVSYVLDSQSNRLSRVSQSGRGEPITRPLFDDVSQWNCLIIEDEEGDRTTLSIEIERSDGTTGTWEFIIP